MKLKSFRVGPYRNIIDSGDIAVDPCVTVLVGKNESGKTNLLHALHALCPATVDRSLPKLDYPRWLQKRHERSGEYEAAKPVEVLFSLTDEDTEAVEKHFGQGVLLDNEFRAFRTYESESFGFACPKCDPEKAIQHCLGDLDVETAPDINILRDRLEVDAQKTDDHGQPLAPAKAATAALTRLTEAFGDDSTVSRTVGEFLSARMPKFFYFDDYAQLPGTTDIAPLVKAIDSGQTQELDDDQRTALALLRMGYADSEIIAEDYDARKAELQAVGAELTKSVLGYWKQNSHLRLAIDVNLVLNRGQNGEKIARRELKLDVTDERHLFTNSLDERSSGFRWFVSFIAAFAEFEGNTNVIVLLDEPGLGLHARAQDDFLKFIDNGLAERHQVLFTTHSPFMVDASQLNRVRVVEDIGPDTGALVSTSDGASKDPDTLFPLQAALGYDIAQNLFVGPHNLVVEGLADFTYLSVLSEHLESLGRRGLDSRWRILPAGGASNIATFVALVGRSLDVSVLVDSGQSSSQKIRNLVDEGLLDGKRLITPGSASTTKSADIEDLFSDAEYLLLYGRALGTKPESTDLGGNDRIVNRIERAFGEYNHNAPAQHLLHNRESLLKQLSDETLGRFEKLFTAINATLATTP